MYVFCEPGPACNVLTVPSTAKPTLTIIILRIIAMMIIVITQACVTGITTRHRKIHAHTSCTHAQSRFIQFLT